MTQAKLIFSSTQGKYQLSKLTKENELYLSRNPDHFQIVECTEDSLELSNFNPQHPIIILAHGWNSNGKDEARGFGLDYAEYYLSVGEYNVFSVDWGELESWTNYPHAAAITRPVGEYAACLGIKVTFVLCH